MAKEVITEDMIIGEVIDRYPASEKVFKKHFGKGCFTCPGSRVEDIAFGSTMHNVEVETVLKELNAVAKKG